MSGPGARQSTNLVSGQRVRSLALMCPVISCVTDRDGGWSQEVDLAGMTIVYASDGQEHLPLIERYLVDGRQRMGPAPTEGVGLTEGSRERSCA
jgi:hypothetical protein